VPGVRIPRRRPPRAEPSGVGVAATDLRGTTPAGSPLEIVIGDRRVVLLFLTSSCYGCQVIWASMAARAAARQRRDGDDAVVLVTPDSSTESATAVARLAPEGTAVLMSSEAWHAYGVTAAPWCVVVAGGVIASAGTAPTATEEVEALLAPPP
jgi:hypothetical protein